MHKPPLKRRELTDLLLHNGFVFKSQTGSHKRYVGTMDGQNRFVDVDECIDEFGTKGDVLYSIVSSQLGFFGDKVNRSVKEGWRMFYAGSPATAKKAGVKYRAWPR